MPPTVAPLRFSLRHVARRASRLGGPLALAGILIAAAGGPAAQERPPLVRVDIETVVQDVSVVDRAGRPVRGLTAADFVVLEDGQPQQVTTFVEVHVADHEPGVAWIREVPPDIRRNDRRELGRLVVIVMDDASGVDALYSAGVIGYARDTARQIIAHLGPHDLAAVVFADRVRRGQELTYDRERLLASVDTYLPNIIPRWEKRLGFRGYQSVLDTLQRVAHSISDVHERRKTVYLLSPGIPLDMVDLAPFVRDPSVPLEDRARTRDLVWRMREILADARRWNVNLHTIDLNGLSVGQDGGDPFRAHREFLQTVSANTGGTAIVNTNDPAPGLVETFQQSGSYYLLGYSPSNERRQGRFRRVDVRVTRPGVEVRTRDGYFEPNAGRTTDRLPVAPGGSVLQQALAGTLPDPGMPLQVAIAPFATPQRRSAALAIVLRMEQDSPATRTIEEVDILIRAFSPGGVDRGSASETARIVLAPGGEPVAVYEVLTRIDLPPGEYALRIAAHSRQRGLSGSVYADVTVPDFTREPLTLSGIAISAVPSPKSASTIPTSRQLPVIPTTERVFTRADDARAFVRIYQGDRRRLQAVDLVVTLTDERGDETILASERLLPEVFGSSRSADYTVALPVAQLTAGSYLLTIRAGAGDRRDARGHVRFSVIPAPQE
jgi:VWFA-related protein